MKRLAIVVLAGLTTLWALPGGAATFTVNSTTDAHDANPGDGVCATSGGECTLKAAVEEANALGGVQAIVLPGGTYALTSGSLYVTTSGADITIDGAGIFSTSIDGNDSTGVLNVEAGASVTLEQAYVSDGHNIYNPGGCFSNYGTLRLNGVFITGCSSVEDGGAIRNSGTLIMWGSTLHDNSATSGGGLSNAGVAELTNVTISNNAGGVGGGIYQWGTTLTLTDVRLQDNQATGGGGGGLMVSDDYTATLTRVTFSGNTTAGTGGGLFARGPVGLTNVTFSGNTTSGAGGAIAFEDSGSLTLLNVTITGSSDDGTAGAFYWGGGGATATVANTLIAGNGSVNCNASLTSLGHNLEDHDTCGLASTGDLVNTTPLLGALADNQGLTKTVALLPGSPGIDAGDDALAPSADQRGVPRPQDGDGVEGAVSDIGAFEYVDLIFVDGFEGGGTFKWSSTVQ